MHTLLFIDDDIELLDIIASSFRDKNYTVHTLGSATDAVTCIQKLCPDCIILDVMMPDMDGFTAFEKIRAVCNTPIIFLTGKISEDDKVNGILMGADDYIEKPFSFRELEARIRMVIRRTTTTPNDNVLLFPPLEIDTAACKVLCGEDELVLTPREYSLLVMMVTCEHDVITYEHIGMFLWGAYRTEDRASVMVNISRLRKKMEVNPLSARMLETVWSEGYRFTGKKAGK